MEAKKPVSFVKSNASVFLDVVRGLAACLVLLDHWRNFLFLDYSQLTAHRALFVLPYLLSSAGHQAVVIFFVLSGFLISGSVFRMLERGTWSWAMYLTHRLMRLWVVLLPGLLLCLLWDSVGLHLGIAPGLYAGHVDNHMKIDAASNLGAGPFFKNLFFLQGLLGHTFGSDGALWSLANEFWYYILFPLGLLTFHPRLKTWKRIVSGVLFVLVAYFVRGGVLWMFPIWLAGTLLCVMPTLRVGRGLRLVAGLLYVFLVFFCARQKLISISGLENDYLLMVGTFLFLWILLSATSEAKASAAHYAGRGLARFSYTLYVVHMPFVMLLTALVAGDTRWTPTGIHVLKALGVLVLALAYSYGVAALTEFQTDKWRRWVEKRLRIGQPDCSTAVTRV